ncbi:MAG: tRNA uridine-5-carboxymethylaminomethyl(34) synthesis GTPase MnmE [Clostridia bacterium]|nr:tRNA uridine-5-carboxymethylaminomethyl(34) synthesis GTPase MnmE [Clostridia bacterium]
MSNVIAAISTAQAAAGIGVIRISGDNARAVAAKVFRAAGDKNILTMPGYTAAYGRVFDGEEEIDEAVALVFAAPKSYTGEDVVELQCHGGMYNLKRVLRAVYKNGAVPAAPGEFTKRAVLNGKLSLTKAEAVMDIIGAQNAQAARAALSARDGAISRRIDAVMQQLLDIAAHLAAWADYPEEDIPEIDPQNLIPQLEGILETMDKILAEYDLGKIMRQGLETAIVGRPNAGKSTIMNLLAGCERSIVTSVPGTTRDIVEETVSVGDVMLRISDTAGLRDTDDPVERIGVERARLQIDRAGLILAVFDAAVPLDAEDLALIDEISPRTSVAIINKTDISDADYSDVFKAKGIPVVMISAKTGEGLDRLRRTIEEVVGLSALNPAAGILANERQFDAARKARQSLAECIQALRSGVTADAVTVIIGESINSLAELTGERASEAVVDRVFEHFCVGK